MRTPQKTITLTVLGGDPSLTDAVRLFGRVSEIRGNDRRLADIRRAMIVIRAGDDTKDLHRRLLDSITRLAGGAAADADRLAGQILRDLRRTPRADAAHRGWTLAHIYDGPASDPYAPRLSRLRLVDAPTRGGVRGRVGQRLRRSTGRAGRAQEPVLHHTPAPGGACLS